MDSERARKVGTVIVLALLVVTGALVATAIQFSSEPAHVDGEIPLGAPNGPTVILDADGETEVNLEDVWNGDELDIETGGGNITVGGDPGANATIGVNDITGTETVATGISGGSDWLELNPEDKQRVDIRGDVDALRFQSVGVDDGSHDLEIVGTDGGTAGLRIHDLPSSESMVLMDPSTNTVLGTGDTDSTGTLETTVDLESSNQQVAVRTLGDITGPTLSNPTPEGEVTELPDELAIDVTAEAYPATVTFTLEGEEVGTVNVTENGTASTPVTVDTLGTYNWSASVEDGAGQTDTIDVEFQTPRNLTIREEHAPQTVVDNSTLTVRFYSADGEIAIEREAPNGTLDMEGLPNSEFVAFVESDKHYDRRVYLDTIFEQQSIYLLNESEFPRGENEAIRSRFTYVDLTGRFPRADTTVQIQRAIDLNGDGTSEWTTVAGDYWGAGGEFEVILENGARYRLFVENQETGATNMVGTHIPTEDLTHEIRISGLTQEAQNASGVFANAELNEEESTIQYVYKDPTGESTDLNIRVTSQSGDKEIYNESVNGTVGTYQDTVELNESQLEDNWIVHIESSRHNSAIPVGAGSVGLPVNVPGWLVTFLVSMAVTFVGALYGPRTALLGAWAMVFVASGVTMFGWAFGWPSVLAATMIAIGATFFDRVFP